MNPFREGGSLDEAVRIAVGLVESLKDPAPLGLDISVLTAAVLTFTKENLKHSRGFETFFSMK